MDKKELTLFDFTTIKHKEYFFNKPSVQKLIEKKTEEPFILLVDDFWDNPKQSFNVLKNKYKVPPEISVYDIIRAYPTDKYSNYFYDCLNDNVPYARILEKYGIPEKKMDDIVFPVYMSREDQYCPYCGLTNEYEFVDIIMEIKNKNTINRYCSNCSSLLSPNEKYITKEESELKMEEFKKELSNAESMIQGDNAIKCYRCQGNYKIVNNGLTYKLKCKKCQTVVENISVAEEEYKKWKQRAAMMITLKAREKEIIEKTIENKNTKDILYKKEDIIKHDDNNFELGISLFNRDLIEAWTDIFKVVKSLNKLGLHILLTIMSLARKHNDKNNENISTWSNNKGDSFETLRFFSDVEPVVIELYKESGIIMLRAELKKIMAKGLILVDEEKNFIDVLKIISDNEESVKKLLIPQKFDNAQLKYLILSNHNFTCYRCGETGRPLKIAYCTSDKKQTDLNLMIPLCDYCFETATEKEILIDGTFTAEVSTADNDTKSKAWEFLTLHYPMLKSDTELQNIIEKLYLQYDESNIIKVLAITLDKMDKDENRRNINFLTTYTNAILKSGEILMGNWYNKYNVEEWLK